jgi:hypothetical protein
MTNINGIFQLEIDGQERELKASVGALERLENHIFKRPAEAVLNDCLKDGIMTSTLVDTILVGLHENRDTRFKREDILSEIDKRGKLTFYQFFIEFLDYLISRGNGLEYEESPEDKKK